MPRDEVLFYTGLPRVEIDGREDTMAAALLQSMEMTESEGGMSSLELCFTNAARIDGRGNEMPFETNASESLALGTKLRVLAGDTHDPQEVFVGKVTALELVLDGAKPPKLIVLAEDALQSARLKRRTKVFAEMSLGDLVAAVAQESGLRVVSGTLSHMVGREVQANETDLGFLRRVCSRFDVDFQVVDEELHISSRSEIDRGTRVLEFGITLTRFRAIADLAEQVSTVTMSGWDTASSQTYSVSSGAGADEGPGEGRKGAEYLEESFKARTEHIANFPVQSQDEAQAVADAMLAARQRRFVSAEGSAIGDPGVRVGVVVDIRGVGERFSNFYYVTHCQHRYGLDDGYITDFRAETAFFGG